MGEMIEFPSNGSTAGGYLATPESGSGPGVIVIQEWWGLVDHIEDVCDRFAAAGFVALAPDLYHGQKVQPGEPDEAGKAMMAMQDGPGRTRHERRRGRGAAAELGRQGRRHRFLHGRRAGARAGDAASRRGGGRGPVLRHHPVARRAARLRVDVRRGAGPLRGEGQLLHAGGGRTRWPTSCARWASPSRSSIYPGTDHAFFNDTRPEVYDADASARAVGPDVGVLLVTSVVNLAAAARWPGLPTRSTGRRSTHTGTTDRPRHRPTAPAGRRRPPRQGPEAGLLPSGHVRTLT